KANQVASGIPHGSQDDIGPKPRAVPAHPPAFVFYSPLGGRAAEQVTRLVSTDIVSGEEHADRLPEDLRALVPRDPLRAVVPTCDVSTGIEQDEGVIADVLDEQPGEIFGLNRDIRVLGPRVLVARRFVRTYRSHHRLPSSLLGSAASEGWRSDERASAISADR